MIRLIGGRYIYVTMETIGLEGSKFSLAVPASSDIIALPTTRVYMYVGRKIYLSLLVICAGAPFAENCDGNRRGQRRVFVGYFVSTRSAWISDVVEHREQQTRTGRETSIDTARQLSS